MSAVLEIGEVSVEAGEIVSFGCWITGAIFDSMDLVAKDAHG
jgi:hypothetical protein